MDELFRDSLGYKSGVGEHTSGRERTAMIQKNESSCVVRKKISIPLMRVKLRCEGGRKSGWVLVQYGGGRE